MEDEVRSLNQNTTWSLKNFAKGKQVIDTKWLYQLKNATEMIIKYIQLYRWFCQQ